MTAHRAVTGASTQGGSPSTYRPARQTSRRAGFIAAALVNGVFLWVVNQLLSWGWPPFLTDDFTDLLPFVDVSLASTVVVNGIWAWRDPSWFRHGAQIGLDCISLVVAVRTWQVFPFDFTEYWSGWETVARVLIVIAVVGMLVDIAVRVLALARGPRGQGPFVPAQIA